MNVSFPRLGTDDSVIQRVITHRDYLIRYAPQCRPAMSHHGRTYVTIMRRSIGKLRTSGQPDQAQGELLALQGAQPVNESPSGQQVNAGSPGSRRFTAPDPTASAPTSQLLPEAAAASPFCADHIARSVRTYAPSVARTTAHSPFQRSSVTVDASRIIPCHLSSGQRSPPLPNQTTVPLTVPRVSTVDSRQQRPEAGSTELLAHTNASGQTVNEVHAGSRTCRRSFCQLLQVLHAASAASRHLLRTPHRFCTQMKGDRPLTPQMYGQHRHQGRHRGNCWPTDRPIVSSCPPGYRQVPPHTVPDRPHTVRNPHTVTA